MNKFVIIGALGIGIFIVIVLGVLFFRNQPSQSLPFGTKGENKVVGFIPPNNSTEVSIAPTIEVTFEKAITNGGDIDFVFAPALPFGTYTVSTRLPARKVAITPDGLLASNTTYQVSVLFQGDEIYQSSFTTVK